MGISGHVGLAFDPADEVTAIACVNGRHEGSEWLRYQTDYGLNRENFWELHLVLQKLATIDPSLTSLATTIIGNREVGEGPYYPMCLYPADEVRRMAEAFAHVDQATLAREIVEITKDVDEPYRQGFALHLRETYENIRREVETVSANGWSFIGAMM